MIPSHMPSARDLYRAERIVRNIKPQRGYRHMGRRRSHELRALNVVLGPELTEAREQAQARRRRVRADRKAKAPQTEHAILALEDARHGRIPEALRNRFEPKQQQA